MTPRFRATLQGDEYTPARLEELVSVGTRTKYAVLHDASLPNPKPKPKPKPHPNLTLTRYGVLHDASLPNFWEKVRVRVSLTLTLTRTRTLTLTLALALTLTLTKFVELNGEMLRANKAIRTGHDWGSRWREWPL